MTPEEVGERMVALLAEDADPAAAEAGAVVAGVSGGGPGHARAVVDVPVARWWAAVSAARDPGALGCDFFDWLSAVDELDEGFTVVAHLWSTRRKHGVLLRTRVPRVDPLVESIVDLFPGAAWHERETFEMFGIGFARHPGLRPLLLPPEFEGHPLRKEFVLASRVGKAWPGAKEPGESDSGAAKRAPMRPPGVPDPNEWGPLKGQLPPAEAAPRRAPGDRPARPAATDRPARPAATDRPARPAPTDRPARPPAADRPARPAATDRPARPAPTDRPAADRPARPPATERPARPPATDSPRRPPATDRPARPPAADRRPTANRPPASERPPTDEPPADEPPAAAPHAAEAPVAEPTAAEPTAAEPPPAEPPSVEPAPNEPGTGPETTTPRTEPDRDGE